jgi:hypothetical protein
MVKKNIFLVSLLEEEWHGLWLPYERSFDDEMIGTAKKHIVRAKKLGAQIDAFLAACPDIVHYGQYEPDAGGE